MRPSSWARTTATRRRWPNAYADAPDGIVYRSRFDSGTTAVVLFDRAAQRVRLFPGSGPVKFGDAEELTAAVRSTVPYSLV